MKKLNKNILIEQRAWNEKNVVDFYMNNRSRLDNLYESEKYFLPETILKVKKVLDVGCAAGGFSQIMRCMNPKIEYIGVDISPEMISIAKRKYPQEKFELSDGINFPFHSEYFDLVHCSGVLHLNSEYKSILRSMWNQTRKYLLFDLRLTWGKEELGKFNVSFKGKKSQENIIPYNVLNISNIMSFLELLHPTPSSILAKGYPHEPSTMSLVKNRNIVMAFFLLEKGGLRSHRFELKVG